MIHNRVTFIHHQVAKLLQYPSRRLSSAERRNPSPTGTTFIHFYIPRLPSLASNGPHWPRACRVRSSPSEKVNMEPAAVLFTLRSEQTINDPPSIEASIRFVARRLRGCQIASLSKIATAHYIMPDTHTFSYKFHPHRILVSILSFYQWSKSATISTSTSSSTCSRISSSSDRVVLRSVHLFANWGIESSIDALESVVDSLFLGEEFLSSRFLE